MADELSSSKKSSPSPTKTYVTTRTRSLTYPASYSVENMSGDAKEQPNPSKIQQNPRAVQPKPTNFKSFIPLQALTDIFGLCYHQSVGSKNHSTMKDKISHLLVEVSNETEKCNTLLLLLPEFSQLEQKTVVFCETEEKAKKVHDILQANRMDCLLVHAHLNMTWESDRRKLHRLVVATDFILKASLECANIVNFDVPSTVSTYMRRAAFATRCHEFRTSSSKALPRPLIINFQAKEDDRIKNAKVETELGIKFENIYGKH